MLSPCWNLGVRIILPRGDVYPRTLSVFEQLKLVSNFVLLSLGLLPYYVLRGAHV